MLAVDHLEVARLQGRDRGVRHRGDEQAQARTATSRPPSSTSAFPTARATCWSARCGRSIRRCRSSSRAAMAKPMRRSVSTRTTRITVSGQALCRRPAQGRTRSIEHRKLTARRLAQYSQTNISGFVMPGVRALLCLKGRRAAQDWRRAPAAEMLHCGGSNR